MMSTLWGQPQLEYGPKPTEKEEEIYDWLMGVREARLEPEPVLLGSIRKGEIFLLSFLSSYE